MKWFWQNRPEREQLRQEQAVSYLKHLGMHVNHVDRDGSEVLNATRAVKGAILMVNSYTADRALVLPDGRVRYLYPWERGDIDWTCD